MNTFYLYWFQFDRDNGQEKKFDTTMVGEINYSKKAYSDSRLTPEEACWKRITTELDYNKGRGADPDIDHIVNFGYRKIESDKKAGVDKEIHKYFKDNLGFEALTSRRGSNTEEFNLGENYLSYINEAIDKCFGQVDPVEFNPRNNQRRCIAKMDEAFYKKGISKFLVGAICRFGKTATLLHYFTKHKPENRILIISAKCDAQNSWFDDWKKFVEPRYKFMTKQDLKDKGLSNDESTIAFVSFQSAAKNYSNDVNEINDDEIADNKTNKFWQEEVAKYDWDVVIIDECHFGSDTARSRNFLNELFKSGNTKTKKVTKKVEVTATYYRKALRNEYDKNNAFIYDLQDERKDYLQDERKDHENEKMKTSNDYSKYVPTEFFHLDLHKFYLQGGFGHQSKPVEARLNKEFANCNINGKFSWDSYFKTFALDTISFHFNCLYKKIFSDHGKRGKHFAVYVNRIEYGKILADALKPSNNFEVINICGNDDYTLARVNRLLNESKKPVIIISCGKYLTGSTLKKLHGTIFMGTCNSAVNFIQYGLRGKNTYENREYHCSVFDLNTYFFLKTDAFKEMITSKARLNGTSIETILNEEYTEDCFEIFELNNFNNFDSVTNFDQILRDNWYISENGGISSLIINEETVSEVLIKKIISEYPSVFEAIQNIVLKENKVIITNRQCDKPGKNKKKKRELNNNDDVQAIKEHDFALCRAKLIAIINLIPHYIHLYKPASIDDIAMCTDENQLKIINTFGPNIVETLKMLKEIWKKDNRDDLWADLNGALFSIAKSFEQ